MENTETALFSARAYKGDRPTYFSDPDVDRLLAMLLALAGELAVTRERLATVEKLLENRDVLAGRDVDEYEPDSEEASTRLQSHEAMIARILRIVHEEIAALDDSE